jgi:hypothetical protein
MSFPPIIIPSPERERWLNEHVPYRIKMLQGLDVFVVTRGRRGPLESVFPSIFESALIACRWSGNFLGLGVSSQGVLRPIKGRHVRGGDVFSIDLGGTLVDPNSLTKSEAALLGCVLLGANVATAHATREGIHPMTWDDVRLAAPLLILQIKLHLYDVLGMRVPEWKRPK